MIRERDIVEQRTGTIYYAARNNPMVNVHSPGFSQTLTGTDTQLISSDQQEIHRDMLPYLLLSRVTGAELPESRAMLTIVVLDIASDDIQTGYRTPLHVGETMRTRLSPARFNRATSPEVSPTVRQVERIRDISGLTIERLAEMFGVSRMTYHKWLSGSPLSDSHREHVLEVQPLMEEAIQRLGNSQSVGNWLLTPVSPVGKKPVEYLKERRYNLFRGFLLHTPTGRERFHPVPPSNPVHRERPRSEVEQVRRLLKPRGWTDDDSTFDLSNEE